jgi:hypothetical protein
MVAESASLSSAPMASAPRSRRLRGRALGDALRLDRAIGPIPIPPTAGFLAGLLAAYLADAVLWPSVGTPLRQVLAAAAFGTVAAPVWLLVQGRRAREAIEVMTWLNGWETERWQREVGRRLPALPRVDPEIVNALPDTLGLRPLRIELLAARGDTAEAWERIGDLPTDTPWQRFEQAAMAEWTLWWTDGPPQIDAMEGALADLAGDDRALVARAMVAAARARRAAVRGEPVVPLLAPLRAELGDRPRRYALPYRTGVLLSVALMAFVASAAVTITAAVIG